jgi:uncharacterized protein (TIGR02186 family)
VTDLEASRTLRLALAAFLLCAVSFTATMTALASVGGDPASLAVSPKRVAVTSRYHGSILRVDLVVPSGGAVALKLEGGTGSVVFNRKGRVFLFWMNVGEVTIGNAPRAYMLYTSKELADLAPPDALQELGLGLDALGPRIETEGSGIGRETMLLEFYNYEKKRGLYRVSFGSLRPEPGGSGNGETGRDRYSARIHLPSGIPVGVYEVGAYVFEHGRLVERTSDTVTVEKVGFSLFVSRLAREHPGEYGVLAIIVAVMAGYAVGLVFSHLGRRRR